MARFQRELLAVWVPLVVLAMLLLLGCDKHEPPPIPPSPVTPAVISMDPGRWQFQFSPGMPRSPTSNLAGGWYFDLPEGPDASGATSVHYLTTAAVGQLKATSLLLEYEIIEAGTPVYQGPLGDPANTCGGPAHFDLYLQRRGDNLQADHEFYRWFYRAADFQHGPGRVVALLSLGWGSVLGKKSDQYPAQFQATLNDLANVGMTFGWGCFSGHGVNLRPGTGTSRFVVKRLTAE